MGRGIEIVCGGARSGKTDHLLELYRKEQLRLLKSAALGEAVWITPTNRSVRTILRALLSGPLPVCFAPNVLTFESFAERILRTTGSAITPLSPVARRMIARCLIDAAKAEGSLAYFAPIADTSGFLDLFLGLVAELKRDETWPDEFEAACRRRDRPGDAELALLYRRYQARLADAALYDGEGRFWSAREALAKGNRGAFGRLSLVIADGFADFSQPQYEILERLADYADRLIVSLPLEEPLSRPDLFAKSALAREEIAQRCPTTPIVLSTAGNADGALLHLAKHLFENPRTVPRLADATGIEIIEAAGPSGEARALAERIKLLLLEGTPPEEIVVAVRGIDEDPGVLAETFAAARIPFWCPVQTPFSHTPLGRAIFGPLRAELEDWSFDELGALLRSNYFRPHWQTFAGDPSVDSALRVLKRFRLGSDRRRILDRVRQLAAAAKIPAEAGHFQRAADLLQNLSAATDRLRSATDFSGWVDRVVALCRELGIASAENGPTGQSADAYEERDRHHWDRLKDVLYDAARAVARLDGEREMSLAEFARQLKDILDSQAVVSREEEAGKVLILEAAEVRNLDVAYLFFAGLSEASFPRHRPDDCFYTESERRRLIRKAHAAARVPGPQQEEMLLFYSIATRARRRLTLSYPSLNAAGQSVFPSPYVIAVRELFEPGAIQTVCRHELDPVAESDPILTDADLRLVAAEEVRHRRPGLFLVLAGEPAGAAAARGIAAAADLASQRFEQRGFTASEGMLSLEQNRAVLAGRFPAEYQFSATQLEQYATCPFRFLLENVLNLEPMEMGDSSADPRERGLRLHRLLAQLHDPSAGSGRKPPMPEGGQIARELRELAAAGFDGVPDLGPFERALLQAERQFMELFIELYAAQWNAYRAEMSQGWDEPPGPRFVELPFGDLSSPDAPPQPQGLPFVTFGKAPDEVRVRGRIDRIDAGRRGDAAAYTVIDYKTRSGRPFHLEELRAGVALQLAIYLSAVRKFKLLGAGTVPFQMAYWSLTRTGCVPALKTGRGSPFEPLSAETVEEIERTLDDLLPRMVSRLRRGEFPVINQDAECTRFCPYSTVCRVNQIRSVSIERGKTWDLIQP